MHLQQLWISDDDTEELKTSFMHSCIVFNFGGANRVCFFFWRELGGGERSSKALIYRRFAIN
jgi:hypothetical protein